jgi:hypothetical protein
MSEPELNLNKYCSICENLLLEAENIFHGSGLQSVEGEFNSVTQWAINAKVMTSCHLCALLLHAADMSVICNLIETEETGSSYRLNTRRTGDGSSLLLNVLWVTVSSETNMMLSQGSVVFREGVCMF